MARAPWQYTGLTQEAVHQFKYAHHWRVGAWLADTMVELARATLPLQTITAVMPVPRHWLKARLSGWTPTAQLALHVARALQKPYNARVLRPTRWTATQTRLNWAQRARNTEDAFRCSAPLRAGSAVLLVDDVLTSGATAHACASTLKQAGAGAVYVLTAAHTPLS